MQLLEAPIWRRFWYPLAFAKELAEGPVARTLLGEALVLWADGEGRPRAAADRCPHRDAPLSGGWIDGDMLVCPYHGWQYAADGRVAVVPQTPGMERFPERFCLKTFRAQEKSGCIWVCLHDDPVRAIPDVPDGAGEGWRWIAEFDEEWAAPAARLMENSFDPAHTVFVHRATFGDTSRPDVETPSVTRTEHGLVASSDLSVANPDIARAVTGETGQATVRSTRTDFFAPFVRVLQSTYPGGTVHQIVTAVAPVDDDHLRLVQWAVRNDTEAEAPATEVVAFDRQVTWEDQRLLESIRVPYSAALDANVHIRVDRATVEIRRIYKEIEEGTWEGLTSIDPGSTGATTTRGASTPTSAGSLVVATELRQTPTGMRGIEMSSTGMREAGTRPTGLREARTSSTGMREAGTSVTRAPKVSSATDDPSAIAVVDLAAATEGMAGDRQELVEQIQTMGEEVGFFVVTGHGVPPEAIEEIYQTSAAFFALPEAEKQRATPAGWDRFCGYAGIARGADPQTDHRVPDLREMFHANRFDDAEEAMAAGYDADIACRLAPNLWPANPPRFRSAWRRYYGHMEALAREIDELLALALGLPASWFEPFVGRHLSNLSANWYPPQLVPPEPGQLRSSPHIDFSLLTILYQDDAPGGLCVRHRREGWIPVPYRPGTFVVNLGDLMNRLTNDRWVATMHKVVNPPVGMADRARISIPYFQMPDWSSVVECVPTCRPSPGVANYPPVLCGPYAEERRAGLRAATAV